MMMNDDGVEFGILFWGREFVPGSDFGLEKSGTSFYKGFLSRSLLQFPHFSMSAAFQTLFLLSIVSIRLFDVKGP
jgi:hypothetical protein